MDIFLGSIVFHVYQVFPDDSGYFFWIAQSDNKLVYSLGGTKEEAIGKFVLKVSILT